MLGMVLGKIKGCLVALPSKDKTAADLGFEPARIRIMQKEDPLYSSGPGAFNGWPNCITISSGASSVTSGRPIICLPSLILW